MKVSALKTNVKKKQTLSNRNSSCTHFSQKSYKWIAFCIKWDFIHSVSYFFSFSKNIIDAKNILVGRLCVDKIYTCYFHYTRKLYSIKFILTFFSYFYLVVREKREKKILPWFFLLNYREFNFATRSTMTRIFFLPGQTTYWTCSALTLLRDSCFSGAVKNGLRYSCSWICSRL